MRRVRTKLGEIPVGQMVALPRQCRCGATLGRLFVIHAGASTRLDCEKCGKTVDFPQWEPRGALGPSRACESAPFPADRVFRLDIDPKK